MGRPTYPPSLRVTPELIERYLQKANTKCQSCGYALRGLPKPKCPECGAWTDVSKTMYWHMLKRVKYRMGGWGVLDRHLVFVQNSRAKSMIAYDDVERVDIKPRWPRAARRLFTLVSIGLSLAMIESFVCLIWRLDGLFAIIAAVLAPILFVVLYLHIGRTVQNWLVVRMRDGSQRKIPIPNLVESDVRDKLKKWRSHMEQAPDDYEERREALVQAEARHVADRICPRCGYGLDGPRYKVREPIASGPGVFFIVLGILIPVGGACCLGPQFSGYWYIEDMGCCALGTVLTLGCIGLGITLVMKRTNRHARLKWGGPGTCSACGWAPNKPPVQDGMGALRE